MSRHAGWLNFFRTEKPVNFLWESDGLEARRPLACPHCGGGTCTTTDLLFTNQHEHENVNNIIDSGATDGLLTRSTNAVTITFSRKGLPALGH
jgi:hypothetical protein